VSHGNMACPATGTAKFIATERHSMSRDEEEKGNCRSARWNVLALYTRQRTAENAGKPNEGMLPAEGELQMNHRVRVRKRHRYQITRQQRQRKPDDSSSRLREFNMPWREANAQRRAQPPFWPAAFHESRRHRRHVQPWHRL